MERFPDVAVDTLLGAAMLQLRKTTNVFREWGSYNVMGTRIGKKVTGLYFYFVCHVFCLDRKRLCFLLSSSGQSCLTSQTRKS